MLVDLANGPRPTTGEEGGRRSDRQVRGQAARSGVEEGQTRRIEAKRPSEMQLHRLRIDTQEARYSASSWPALPRKRVQFAASLEAMQDCLADHDDMITARFGADSRLARPAGPMQRPGRARSKKMDGRFKRLKRVQRFWRR